VCAILPSSAEESVLAFCLALVGRVGAEGLEEVGRVANDFSPGQKILVANL
jgi:hypothetical protein